MPSRPPTFRPQRQRTARQVDADYDRRRGSARARGYNAKWDDEAAQEKVRRPYCLGCEATGRSTPTDLIDHIVPHKGNNALFWDRSNWQPACRFHHDVVKQKLERMYASGEIGIDCLRLDSLVARELSAALA